MKITHIINSDIRGGAPRAALGICNALRDLGEDSRMLVQRKFGDNDSVASVSDGFVRQQMTNARMLADIIQMKLYTREDKGRFSFGTIGTDISRHPLIRSSDVIHLHWINEGYISLKGLEYIALLNKPVVWTLHDMWTFTGGCHYSAGCKKYQKTCHECPFLKTPSENDFSAKLQNRKRKLIGRLNPYVVTCSRWLGEEARKSYIMSDLRITSIPNAINTGVYKPSDKTAARKKLNLPLEKTLILFTALNASEERKGFPQLKETLKILIDRYPAIKDSAELMVLGTSDPGTLSDLPVRVNPLGRLYGDELIAACYNAADIFVAPSLEDNLPNTVMEALACGVPAAAFNIGGMPDMIEHNSNGFLASPYSASDLAGGIYSIVSDRQRLTSFAANAREKVLNSFTPEAVASRYLELYKSLVV
ncbi:MAG: glycosyltransferase family 4 protein [Bacteroidota bacterium]